jgi:hypothetical protein
MDRYISTTVTMNSVSSISRIASVVVGVAILGGPALLLHARAHSWRWAPLAESANFRAFQG